MSVWEKRVDRSGNAGKGRKTDEAGGSHDEREPKQSRLHWWRVCAPLPLVGST